MKLPILTIITLAMCLLSGRLDGHGTEELLTTVGTTVVKNGHTHAYLLWQPGDAASTLGKRFAIYAKPGAADSPVAFTRLGIQTLQTSPNTIRAMLELGANVDRAAAAAPTRIDGLYREMTYRAGAAPATPANPTLDAGGKLAFLMQSAVTDSKTLSRLFFLGRAHPGVMMALGHAFAIQVTAGIHTFEVREVASVDQDVRVVGRVTLDTGAPVILNAPAAPVQVWHTVHAKSQFTLSPKDDLNVRLRWGVDPILRAKMPHSFGFDVFRVAKATAESIGWHTTPPTSADILTAIASANPTDPNPAIAMANELPVLVGDLLTPAQAGDAADTERFDFSDDGVWYQGPDGKKLRRPYIDGEAFYYFIAARGITGEPGNLSAGTLVTMCDRQPPHPPVIASVMSQFVRPQQPADWETQGGAQYLQVKFRQLPTQPQTDSATGYYIYRWSKSQEYLDHLGDPLFGRIGTISHLTGSTFRTFNDNGANSPTLTTHPNQAVWYTIRSIGVSTCAQNEVLSGHSAPMAGYLRDLKAPSAPIGDFTICRQVPSATFVNRLKIEPGTIGLPATFTGISIEATRTSTMIVAAIIEVAIFQADNSWMVVYSKQHAYQTGNILRADLPYREPVLYNNRMRIRVSAVTANGSISDVNERQIYYDDQAPYALHRYNLGAQENCVPRSSVPDDNAIHEAFTPAGITNPIIGSISFVTGLGVREWRVYRRVGSDGPLSLIAKQEGDTIPNPGTWTDGALPVATGTTVCYFGQILDQNANPSALQPLGCVTLLNPDLPTPMLSPVSLLSLADQRLRVKLEWFCDPAGVDRFEILAARYGGGVPEVLGLSPLLTMATEAIDSKDFPNQSYYRYQTPRLGPEFAVGPAFSIEVTVPSTHQTFFAVRACGPGEATTHAGGPWAVVARAHGSSSNVVNAINHSIPSVPPSVIPWPARDVPDAFNSRMRIEQYTTGEGPLWPLVLPTDYATPTAILVGLTRHHLLSYNWGTSSSLASPERPETYLFKLRENSETSTGLGNLMPCMLFRYQMPSAAFPSARANLVQCTPLIDRMSWKNMLKDYSIKDPFFLIMPLTTQAPLPVSGNWTDTTSPVVDDPITHTPLPTYLEGATGMMLLKDPLPVTTGAKYRHLLVQFDARGEIKRVIPLTPVQH
jgi:hypothetical protein